MSYLGLCSKFGLKGMIGVHLAAPALPALGCAFKALSENAALSAVSHEALRGATAGSLALVAASSLSMLMTSDFGLDRSTVGVSRGSGLLQKWQMAAYAVTLAAGVALIPSKHPVDAAPAKPTTCAPAPEVTNLNCPKMR
jgi:hypothetical protein